MMIRRPIRCGQFVRGRALAIAGLTLSFGLVLSFGVGRADDWAQFGGPTRNGHAPDDAKLATSWPEAGPKAVWSIATNPGFGGAAVHGDDVFITERLDDASDVLRCLSLATGEERWRFTNAVPGRLSFNGSRSVPSVTADRVFMTGPFGHLYCVDRATHKAVWTKHTLGDYGGGVPKFGYAPSPLLYGDLVIVPALGPEVGVVAYNQADGEVVWTSEGVGDETYASPTIHRIGGVDHVVFASRRGRDGVLTGFDPATGERLWQFDDFQKGFPIPAPTEVAEGTFFFTAGYKSGSVMVKVTARGGVYSVSETFRVARDGAQIHPAMFHDGHLYVNFNRNANLKRRPVGLVCMGLDGEIKWKTEKMFPIERGGLLMVGEKMLALDGQDGVLRLIDPNPDGYTELANAKVFPGLRRRENNIWAPMAYVDGKLLVRSQGALICLDLREGAGAAGKKAPKKKKGPVLR